MSTKFQVKVLILLSMKGQVTVNGHPLYVMCVYQAINCKRTELLKEIVEHLLMKN